MTIKGGGAVGVTMFNVVHVLGFYMRLRILSQIMYNFVSAGLNFFLTSCEEKNCLTAWALEKFWIKSE